MNLLLLLVFHHGNWSYFGASKLRGSKIDLFDFEMGHQMTWHSSINLSLILQVFVSLVIFIYSKHFHQLSVGHILNFIGA